MTLVFDRTAELAGQPQTHAYLVGVSEYPAFPAWTSRPIRRASGCGGWPRRRLAPGRSAAGSPPTPICCSGRWARSGW
ncbi:hypothetical protein AJ88_15645 [Mesorhizobium amorphae CCBAU 01583]|nr:hypothetical protein AJ88_15645 [Mesorhizobium amorphae CCBAU 01583]